MKAISGRLVAARFGSFENTPFPRPASGGATSSRRRIGPTGTSCGDHRTPHSRRPIGCRWTRRFRSHSVPLLSMGEAVLRYSTGRVYLHVRRMCHRPDSLQVHSESAPTNEVTNRMGDIDNDCAVHPLSNGTKRWSKTPMIYAGFQTSFFIARDNRISSQVAFGAGQKRCGN